MSGLRVMGTLAILLVAVRAEAQVAPSPTAPTAPPMAPPPPPPATPGPAQDPEANTWTSPPESQETPPAETEAVESESAPALTGPPPAPILEPPPPGGDLVFEPPPPPVAQHVAPRTSLWLGVRAGWFVPFGSLYARALPPDRDGIVLLDPVRWRSYASTGLALEGNVGLRLARSYVVFALWERAQLGGGSADEDLYGEQTSAESDFWAAAVRATSNADKLGFLTEIAVGYRQARTRFEDGTKLELTGAAFEGRLGVGAEYRFNEHFSLSPLATIGVGSFTRVRRVTPDGAGYDPTGPRDASDSHAWFALTVGGHVDLLGQP